MFLFDTDHLGILELATGPEFRYVMRRMAEFEPEDFFVSIISFHEHINGWNAYLKCARSSIEVVRTYSKFERVLTNFTELNVVAFDECAAKTFDALRGQRLRLGTMDLRIGAVALVNDYIVLTRNLVDFERIPNLKVQDWTTAIF